MLQSRLERYMSRAASAHITGRLLNFVDRTFLGKTTMVFLKSKDVLVKLPKIETAHQN